MEKQSAHAISAITRLNDFDRAICRPSIRRLSIDQAGYSATYLYLALVDYSGSAQTFAGGMRRGKTAGTVKQKSRSQIAGARELLAQAPLRRTLITSAAVLTGTDLFQFYMPIYGHSIGLSTQIGVVLSMVAIAGFIIRIGMPALVRRAARSRLLAYSLFLGSATYLLFPFFTDITVLTCIAFMLGLSLGCGQPLSLIMVYARAPQGRSGEALGLRLAITDNFTHIAVPLVFGSLGSALGLAPVFWANALMLAGGGALNRTRRA